MEQVFLKLTKGTYTQGIRVKYEGEWKDGAKHGKGTVSTPARSPELRQRGQVRGRVGERQNQRERYGAATLGVYQYSDRTKFDGQWKQGAKEGKGAYVYRNGDRYEGEWREGEVEKKGKGVGE